jgi:hypothetical protein
VIEMTMQATLVNVKATAAEWYEFPGSAVENKPAYRVARRGTTVTSQVENEEVETIECDGVEEARAEFAEQTLDPDGPAAAQPGDLIRIVWSDLRSDAATGEQFVVNSVSRREHDGWDYFYVSADTRPGRPLKLLFGQYTILARPAS